MFPWGARLGAHEAGTQLQYGVLSSTYNCDIIIVIKLYSTLLLYYDNSIYGMA